MEEIKIDFGTNLRKYRKASSLSRQELGDMISYSAKSVEKWELGGSPPPIETICKIARVFGVTVDRLVMGEKKEANFLLAIDGGGTKTEFLLTDLKRKEVSRVYLGASNPVDIGMESTQRILSEGIREVCRGIDLRQVALFAGLAGGITGTNKAQINDYLSTFGFAFYANGSDTENVLEIALEGGDGVAVIMGTGIIAFSQENGKRHRIGGWGYHIDSGGSGYNIGSQALEAALKYSDGRNGSRILNELIEDAMGKSVSDCIADIYSGGKAKVASFAPFVFKAYKMGDEFSRNIIEANVREVCEIITAGIKHVSTKEPRVVICGGLASCEDILKPFFAERLGKKINLEFSVKPVVNGALMLAEKLKNGGNI